MRYEKPLRRSPLGERELKLWECGRSYCRARCRSPLVERELKRSVKIERGDPKSRSPLGKRELKCMAGTVVPMILRRSLLHARGATFASKEFHTKVLDKIRFR